MLFNDNAARKFITDHSALLGRAWDDLINFDPDKHDRGKNDLNKKIVNIKQIRPSKIDTDCTISVVIHRQKVVWLYQSTCLEIRGSLQTYRNVFFVCLDYRI